MFNTITIIMAVAITVMSAEIPVSYSLLDKQANTPFKPDIKTEPIETHAVFKKDNKPDLERHPVYRGEEHRNEGRANIEPVRPKGPVVIQGHEGMLADQPEPSTEVNRIDTLNIPSYGYMPAEVAYPDIPYAPGYNYDTAYSPSNSYELYNSPSNYFFEPDTSTFGLLWSQVPETRTVVSYVGKTVAWIFSSIFVILLGSLLTVGVCSYTNLCSITFHGVGPIHEEMRALMTPERLEKISHAADFVKTAIDKYQKIQKIPDPGLKRRRRSPYY